VFCVNSKRSDKGRNPAQSRKKAKRPAAARARRTAAPSDAPRSRASQARSRTPKKSAQPVVRSATQEFEKLLKSAALTNERYVLRLYVTGTTPRSTRAVQNLRSLCDRHLEGRYDLEIIDIYQQPRLASGDQIIAAPTLIKQLPEPIRKVIGDLSDEKQVLMGLDLVPSAPLAATCTPHGHDSGE
jgi:circadian clock protein KaiB